MSYADRIKADVGHLLDMKIFFSSIPAYTLTENKEAICGVPKSVNTGEAAYSRTNGWSLRRDGQ